MNARLECDGLAGGWGSLTAFRDLDISVDPGTVHAILGPNGAGKTTLLLTIAGLLTAHKGSIAIDGHALKAGRATAAGRAGVVLVPDNRELFTTLTVEENLLVASGRRGPEPRSMLALFPALEARWKLRAGALSGGEQQMLAMARALIQRPKVLLVDELSMGLAPIIVERLFDAIRRVASDDGCAVVFVEQYVGLALKVADSVTVINHGEVILSGPARDIAEQPEVLEHAYLGSTQVIEEKVSNGNAVTPPQSAAQ
jgi:branched-chain amino acid transport system ATP-binding protein